MEKKYIPKNKLEARATIDAGYFMLKKISEQTRSTIEILIDQTTDNLSYKIQIKLILEDVIIAKKYLGESTENEYKLLGSLSNRDEEFHDPNQLNLFEGG